MNNSWGRVSNFKDAFSLMEMMAVLLIVAILAAATAPMVTKKMARNAGSGDSPWVFTGLSNDIAYNMNGRNDTAVVGAARYNAGGSGPAHPRFVLANGNDNQPALVFARNNGDYLGQIVWNDTKVAMNNDARMGDNSVAFGMGQTISDSPQGIVAIGHGVDVNKPNAIAIGIGAKAKERDGGIAIGNNAYVDNTTSRPSLDDGHSIAIGNNALAYSSSSNSVGNIAIGASAFAYSYNGDNVALGNRAQATGNHSVAIGYNAKAEHTYSVAIGAGTETTADYQIVLGGPSDTVYIPGNLIVEGNVRLAQSSSSRVYMRIPPEDHLTDGTNTFFNMVARRSGERGLLQASRSDIEKACTEETSDRRLKNVGEKYIAGLDELKKLEFFHYTFKKDEAKTPHVGVMAQDLQKVFPDAVTKGEDGYLRIRKEDMFYAIINAVKELDTKICEIVENITSLSKKLDEQQQLIETQQTLIEELQKQNVDLEKRLMKLEKKRHVELAN